MLFDIKKIFTLLFPHHCILCSALSHRQQDLCEACYRQLPWITTACSRCALPLPSPALFCGTCLSRPPPFDITCAAFQYEIPIIKLVLELKFKHTLINARLLGELLLGPLLQIYKTRPLPEQIIPVPLHVNRLKERGFNQALEIARPIAKALNRPINVQGCQRAKPTLPQATLSATARLQNVQHAFVINENLTGQHIAIIDDVMTTGHTLIEFSKALRKKGAKTIDVWCSARSVFS